MGAPGDWQLCYFLHVLPITHFKNAHSHTHTHTHTLRYCKHAYGELGQGFEKCLLSVLPFFSLPARTLSQSLCHHLCAIVVSSLCSSTVLHSVFPPNVLLPHSELHHWVDCFFLHLLFSLQELPAVRQSLSHRWWLREYWLRWRFAAEKSLFKLPVTLMWNKMKWLLCQW